MKTKSKTTARKSKTKLADMIAAAKAAGCDISFSLGPQMPLRFPSDPEPVKLLLGACEKMNARGNSWIKSKNHNPFAADMAYKMGWAYGIAAAWLRCELKGEFTKDQDDLIIKR